MECPFELPVYKDKSWDKILFCVREAKGHLLIGGLPELKADYIVQAINSHEKLVSALDWIKGATDIEEDRCKCGRPTGVLAIHNHAEQALKDAEKQ